MVAQPQRTSPEEYLENEKSSLSKHEYVNGRVYAMTGASDAHVTILLNLGTLLRNHLRGGGCRLYASDMKVRIEQLNVFYYPDLLVTCDERDSKNDYFKANSCLIVEVLSPTTEAADRGRKFNHYRQLASLQEYVLISQGSMNVDVFRRESQGIWSLYPLGASDELCLESINFSCPVAALYEDVTLTEES